MISDKSDNLEAELAHEYDNANTEDINLETAALSVPSRVGLTTR